MSEEVVEDLKSSDLEDKGSTNQIEEESSPTTLEGSHHPQDESTLEETNLLEPKKPEDQLLPPVNAPKLRKKRTYKPVDPMVVSARWKQYFDPVSRCYYYDKKSKQTQWNKPIGYLNKLELLRPVAAVRIGSTDWLCVTTFNNREYFYNEATTVTAWELPEDFNTPIHHDMKSNDVEADETSQDDTNSKKRGRFDSDFDIDAEGSTGTKRHKSEEMSSYHRDPQYPEEIVPEKEDLHERKVRLFKLMLRQAGVDSRSSWSDWQSQLSKDSRFTAVVSPVERRSFFENFVRSCANETKNVLKLKIKAARDSLLNVVQQYDQGEGLECRLAIDEHLTFAEFKDLFRASESYQTLRDLSPEDLISVYDEVIGPLKEKKSKLVEKAKKSFLALLDEKIYDDFIVDTRKDWLDFKLRVEHDPRYNRQTLSGMDREELFERWAKDVKLELDASRQKSLKTNEALRKREEEARKQIYREEARIREKQGRSLEQRETSGFNTLLSERILRSDVSWETAVDLIQRDPRYDTQILRSREKKELFEEHLAQLKKKAQNTFLDLIEERGTCDFLLSWEEYREFIVDSSRFKVIPDEMGRRQVFEKWVEKRLQNALDSLNKLFLATHQISHDTDLTSKKERAEILDELRKDPRWRSLPEGNERWDKLRFELLEDFVEALEKKGKV